MTEAEKQALARAEAAEKQLADLQSAQAKAEREAAHTANADFAESLVKSGKLKPAHKALAVRVLDFVQYPNDITADFGEGENQHRGAQQHEADAHYRAASDMVRRRAAGEQHGVVSCFCEVSEDFRMP